jgi:dihydroflavonol-4-reductase
VDQRWLRGIASLTSFRNLLVVHLLITGATGLLGSNLVNTALSQGHQVTVLHRGPAHARPLVGLDIRIAAGDIRDPDAIDAACRGGIDAIIHSAGLIHIGWQKLDESMRVNRDGTRIIAEAAVRHRLRLIHISTVNTLPSGEPGKPVDETTVGPPKVPCAYVVSKQSAEAEVAQRLADGLDAVIIHPAFMLGPLDWKPSSGRMICELDRHWSPYAPWGGMSVCDARDVATACLAALQQAPTGRHYILAGHNMLYIDLWKAIASALGRRSPWLRARAPARWIGGVCGDLWGRITGREPDVNSAAIQMSSLFHYYSSQRAIDELGYHIRPFEETLSDAVAWLRDHGYLPSR